MQLSRLLFGSGLFVDVLLSHPVRPHNMPVKRPAPSGRQTQENGVIIGLSSWRAGPLSRCQNWHPYRPQGPHHVPGFDFSTTQVLDAAAVSFESLPQAGSGRLTGIFFARRVLQCVRSPPERLCGGTVGSITAPRRYPSERAAGAAVAADPWTSAAD